jgi:hypothetical protein
LDNTLSRELDGRSIKHQNIIDDIFTDEALGFKVGPLVEHLDSLAAFARNTTARQPNETLLSNFFHDALKRNVNDEARMSDHLNHLISVLEEHLGKKSGRKWCAGNHSETVFGLPHPRKFDIALWDEASINESKVLGWMAVHSIAEICNKHPRYTIPPNLKTKGTIRNKSLKSSALNSPAVTSLTCG